ncbi:MAG: leucine-rich repeat domain-containing protein [Aureispira sp.]|nr:leucine-rich repeat domain-containing protein [Aureispira sp.]
MKTKLDQLLFSHDEANFKIAMELAQHEPTKTQLGQLVPNLLEYYLDFTNTQPNSNKVVDTDIKNFIEHLLFSAEKKKIDFVFELGEKTPFKKYLDEIKKGFINDLDRAFFVYEDWGINENDDPIEVYKHLLLNTQTQISDRYSTLDKHMRQWRKIDMENSRIEELPSWLGKFKNLESINAPNANIKTIELGFYNLVCLKELNINSTPLSSISTELKKLKNLVSLNLQGCECSLPKEIGELENLTYLNLCGFQEPIPSTVGNLKRLKHLDLSESILKEIPKEFFNLKSLEHLNVNYTEVEHLSECIGDLKNLVFLDIGETLLSNLPKRLWDLENLIHLNLRLLDISELPVEIQNLKKLNYLNITRTDIVELPKTFVHLTHLKKLNLNGECLVNSFEILSELSSLIELRFYIPKDTIILGFEENLEKIRSLFPNKTILATNI